MNPSRPGVCQWPVCFEQQKGMPTTQSVVCMCHISALINLKTEVTVWWTQRGPTAHSMLRTHACWWCWTHLLTMTSSHVPHLRPPSYQPSLSSLEHAHWTKPASIGWQAKQWKKKKSRLVGVSVEISGWQESCRRVSSVNANKSVMAMKPA